MPRCSYEGGLYRHWVLYWFTFLCVGTVAGVVYGWPALRSQLQEDGSELDEKELGLVFTIGAWSTQGGRFFVGLARDRIGTRICACGCMVAVALGSLGIAVCDPSNSAGLALSLFALGLGSGVQLTTQPVAGLFPRNSGTVMSSLAGAFQISGTVFLALTASNASRKNAFLGFMVYSLILASISFFLLPKGKSFELEEDETRETTALTFDPALEDSGSGAVVAPQITDADADGGTSQERTGSVEEKREAECDNGYSAEVVIELGSKDSKLEATADDVETDSSGQGTEKEVPPTAMEQMKSTEYLLLMQWFCVVIIPLQYYIGTIGFQLEDKGDDGSYTDLFAIIYAAATIVSPLGGVLADRLSLGIGQGIATLILSCSLFILGSGISLEGQVLGIILYGIGRMLIFGMYFANCGKRFGYANYGTLAGLGLIGSAIVSLIQYPFISIASDGSASEVNIGLAVFTLAQFPYFVWLHRKEKQK